MTRRPPQHDGGLAGYLADRDDATGLDPDRWGDITRAAILAVAAGPILAAIIGAAAAWLARAR